MIRNLKQKFVSEDSVINSIHRLCDEKDLRDVFSFENHYDGVIHVYLSDINPDPDLWCGVLLDIVLSVAKRFHLCYYLRGSVFTLH